MDKCYPEDLSLANIVTAQPMHPNARAVNTGFLTVPLSLGRRVAFRLSFEIRLKWGASTPYKRLHSSTVLFSAPDAKQALLLIEAIRRFALSLTGKWLAPPPDQL